MTGRSLPARTRGLATPGIRLAVAGLVLTLVAMTAATPLAAQGGEGGGFLQRANLDRLQLVSLGAAAGGIRPSQLESATIFAVEADYGEISPGWRVEFGVSYFGSRYESSAVQAFVDSLTLSVDDPSGQARVIASPVTLYDVTLSIGFRRFLRPSADFTPTMTLGIAAHVINAEGRLIEGTFVERALDDIAGGLFAEVGIHRRFLRRFELEVLARGDLLSAYRSLQARAGMSYYFGDPRRPRS